MWKMMKQAEVPQTMIKDDYLLTALLAVTKKNVSEALSKVLDSWLDFVFKPVFKNGGLQLKAQKKPTE